MFVNEGPGLAMIQKATHQSLKTVPIREAALRAHVPASVTRQSAGVASHEQPQHSWFEHRNPAPTKAAEAPARAPVQDRANPQARDSFHNRPEYVFGPHQPAGHEASPSREREAEHSGDHGSKHDKDQGHDHGGGKQ